MTTQKNGDKNVNDVERENVVVNQIIDTVKVVIPSVAGFMLIVFKFAPKAIKLIK